MLMLLVMAILTIDISVVIRNTIKPFTDMPDKISANTVY